MADEPNNLEELIKQLLAVTVASNEARGDAEKEAKEQRDKATAKQDKEDKKIGNQLRQADGHLTNLPVIGKMTKFISSQINQVANQSLKLQEAALSRGMTLGSAIDRNSKVQKQLTTYTGAAVGSMAAVQTNFEMFAGGLGDASYETSRLVHATRLSSGQQKQLIAGLAKNTRGMGFTSEETSRLADTTLGMSQKYGISTNELVNAVGGLSDQLYDFAALGIGAEIQEAATVLAAGLGPAMAKVGPELIGAFTKGDSMIQASLLGVSAERAELLKQGGDQTKAAIGLVTKGGAEAERLINQWTSGGMDRGLALQQLTQIYGKETTQLLAARNELQDQADARKMSLTAYTKQMQKEAKIKEEWATTWQNFKDRVVSPLQEVVMAFVNFGLQLISYFGPLIKVVAQLSLGVVSLMMAVIAMKKAFILWQVAQKGYGMAKGAIGAAGGGLAGAGRAAKGGIGAGWDKLKGFITGKKGGGAGGGLGDKLKGFITGKKGGGAGGGLGAPKPGGGGGAMPGAPAGGGGLGGFLGKLGDGLKKLGTTGALKGAAVIAILAASLAIAAVGFGLFGKVNWESIAKGTVALGILGTAAYYIGKVKDDIAKGAGAIALLGLSLIPLAFAFNLIKAVGIGTMFGFAGALIVLSIAAIVFGNLIVPISLGAAAFLILGLSLIPLAFALRIAAPAMDSFMTALIRFKDVPLLKLLGFAFVLPFLAAGMMTLALVAPGMFVLGVAMTLFIGPFMKFVIALSWFKKVPLGKILGFALMMPLFAYGIATLGLVAGPLLFLGIAMSLFIGPFMKLILALTWLNDVPIGKMFLLMPALMAITYGLLAMTAGGLLMAAFDGLLKLFGADSPIDKVVKMGKAAEHINKMAKTLKTLPRLLRQTVKEMAKIKLAPFYLLAHGLGIVKKAIDNFSLMDMLKFKMFGIQPAAAKAKPMDKVKQAATERPHKQSYSKWPVQQRKKKESSWSFQSEGIGDIFMPKAGEAPAKVDQARIDRKKGEIQELGGRAANMREGSRGRGMVERQVGILEEQLIYLKQIYDKQEEGNEIGVEGNSDRREGHRTQRGRPTDRIAGAGVVGSLD